MQLFVVLLSVAAREVVAQETIAKDDVRYDPRVVTLNAGPDCGSFTSVDACPVSDSCHWTYETNACEPGGITHIVRDGSWEYATLDNADPTKSTFEDKHTWSNDDTGQFDKPLAVPEGWEIVADIGEIDDVTAVITPPKEGELGFKWSTRLLVLKDGEMLDTINAGDKSLSKTDPDGTVHHFGLDGTSNVLVSQGNLYSLKDWDARILIRRPVSDAVKLAALGENEQQNEESAPPYSLMIVAAGMIVTAIGSCAVAALARANREVAGDLGASMLA